MENEYRAYLETFVSKFKDRISNEHCTMDLINFMVRNPSSDYLDYLKYCNDYWRKFERENNMLPTETIPGIAIDEWTIKNCLSYKKWLENERISK